MGVYHCDCGVTLWGESFECEGCGRGGGDGTILCQLCAEACCADAETKNNLKTGNDLKLLEQCLRKGIWTSPNSKYGDFEAKTIQSDRIKRILEKVIADPTGVAALLDESEKRPGKKPKKARRPAAADEVITIE